MIVDRSAFPWLLALAGAAGFFLSEATHQPRYQLVGTANPGIGHRINTETGEAVACIATREYTLVCGSRALTYHPSGFQWGR